MIKDCYTCREEAGRATAPFAERLYVDNWWRVAHAFNTTLAGWLVAMPRRHVTSIADLSGAEAEGLGRLLHQLGQALQEVTGCAKTYVMQFAEAEGFEHVHFHVVPRMQDLASEYRGPRIFHYLTRPEREWLTVDARTDVARQISRCLVRH